MKIVIGTDGSEFSNAAIDACCELIVKADEAEIRILTAYEAPSPIGADPVAMSAEIYQELVDIAEDRAKGAADQAANVIRKRFPDLKMLSTKVELGRPAMIIIEAAEKWKADLIVVGSHGHGFWGRALLGSVSDAVVHHAPCSVLIVRKP